MDSVRKENNTNRLTLGLTLYTYRHGTTLEIIRNSSDVDPKEGAKVLMAFISGGVSSSTQSEFFRGLGLDENQAGFAADLCDKAWNELWNRKLDMEQE